MNGRGQEYIEWVEQREAAGEHVSIAEHEEWHGGADGATTDLAALHADWRSLQEHLDDVTARRKTAKADLDAEIERVTKEWQERNAELLSEYDAVLDAHVAKDAELRDAIIAAYTANPASKKVAPGLSVRVNTKLEYDKAKALEWAIQHKMALALDTKAFETVAKVAPPEFVKVVEVPTAVIGK